MYYGPLSQGKSCMWEVSSHVLPLYICFIQHMSFRAGVYLWSKCSEHHVHTWRTHGEERETGLKWEFLCTVFVIFRYVITIALLYITNVFLLFNLNTVACCYSWGWIEEIQQVNESPLSLSPLIIFFILSCSMCVYLNMYSINKRNMIFASESGLFFLTIISSHRVLETAMVSLLFISE